MTGRSPPRFSVEKKLFGGAFFRNDGWYEFPDIILSQPWITRQECLTTRQHLKALGKLGGTESELPRLTSSPCEKRDVGRPGPNRRTCALHSGHHQDFSDAPVHSASLHLSAMRTSAKSPAKSAKCQQRSSKDGHRGLIAGASAERWNSGPWRRDLTQRASNMQGRAARRGRRDCAGLRVRAGSGRASRRQ